MHVYGVLALGCVLKPEEGRGLGHSGGRMSMCRGLAVLEEVGELRVSLFGPQRHSINISYMNMK